MESGVEERKIAHGGAFDVRYYSIKVMADCFESPGFVESFEITQPYTLLPATRKKKRFC